MKLVRIWFQKRDAARYISHLDLNRCVARAFQMAQIPLWHTQGFHPHAFITFALPLSLGITGYRESMDIKLKEEIGSEELLSRLNACLPNGIKAYDVTEPVKKPGEIAAASYRLTLDAEERDPAALAEKITELFSQEELIVSKRSKSGEKDVNLHQWLDRTAVHPGEGCVVIDAVLPAGSAENVNPGLLLSAIRDHVFPGAFARVERLFLLDGENREFS